jgi:hypothetical protein
LRMQLRTLLVLRGGEGILCARLTNHARGAHLDGTTFRRSGRDGETFARGRDGETYQAVRAIRRLEHSADCSDGGTYMSAQAYRGVAGKHFACAAVTGKHFLRGLTGETFRSTAGWTVHPNSNLTNVVPSLPQAYRGNMCMTGKHLVECTPKCCPGAAMSLDGTTSRRSGRDGETFARGRDGGTYA